MAQQQPDIDERAAKIKEGFKLYLPSNYYYLFCYNSIYFFPLFLKCIILNEVMIYDFI